MMPNLDHTTIIPFPDKAFWAELYQKSHGALVESVRRYSQTIADAEDAVEEAFYKLMHKKDPDAYGDRMPQTEKGWFWALYWQARAYLSHLRDRVGVHAMYVERISVELESVFACGHQGEEMDEEVRSRALARALETLRAEQDISRRNLEVFILRTKGGLSSKEVAANFGIAANNVDQIVYRVRRLVRKYGPRHFEAALRREGYGHYKWAA